MKVALCLSGQPRLYKEAYPYIKHYLINRYKIKDIFCHFWWDPQTNEQGQLAGWSNSYYEENNSNENILQNLINLYNPRKIGFDPPKQTTTLPPSQLSELSNYYIDNPELSFYDYDPEYQSWAKNHLSSILESQYKTLQYKNEYEEIYGEKYDLIIRTRYDIGFKQELPTLDQIQSKLIQSEKNYFRIWTDFWMYSSKIHDKIVGGMWEDFDRLFGFINSPFYINPYPWIKLKASPEYIHWARLMELDLMPNYDNPLNVKFFILRK